MVTNENYFGGMLQGNKKAQTKRFNPETKGAASSNFFLNNFTTQITRQMVDPQDPKLTIGKTEAGKIVADNVEELAKVKLELGKVQRAQDILFKG